MSDSQLFLTNKNDKNR